MRFKWTVEIEVDESWVADGFNLRQSRADDMAERIVPWAESDEVSMKVLSSPDPEAIARAQGYANAAELDKADKEAGII